METNIQPCRTRLCICIETDPLLTLESVLATIRRLGIELKLLHLKDRVGGVIVHAHLAAESGDTLELCSKRLRNIIGIGCVLEYGKQNQRRCACKPELGRARSRPAPLLNLYRGDGLATTMGKEY